MNAKFIRTLIFLPTFLVTVSAFGILDAAKDVTSADLAIMQKNSVRVGWMVDGKFSTICTGVLISSSKVLTADHCLKDRDADVKSKKIIVQVYDPILRKSSVIDVTSRDDSAVVNGGEINALTLAKDAPNKDIAPITFGACDKDSEMYIAGFGNDGQGPLKSTLKFAKYRELTAAESAAVYNDMDFRQYRDKFLHVKSVSGMACNGDSGSPIYCRSKGKLAVAAILSGLDYDPSKPYTVPDTAPITDHCRARPFAAATKLSAHIDQINKWRSESSTTQAPEIENGIK